MKLNMLNRFIYLEIFLILTLIYFMVEADARAADKVLPYSINSKNNYIEIAESDGGHHRKFRRFHGDKKKAKRSYKRRNVDSRQRKKHHSSDKKTKSADDIRHKKQIDKKEILKEKLKHLSPKEKEDLMRRIKDSHKKEELKGRVKDKIKESDIRDLPRERLKDIRNNEEFKDKVREKIRDLDAHGVTKNKIIEKIKKSDMSLTDKKKIVERLKHKDLKKKKLLLKELRTLPPEQKKKVLSELRDKHPVLLKKLQRIKDNKEKISTYEGKDKAKKIVDLKRDFNNRREERKNEFLTRWDNATVANKQEFCNAALGRCGSIQDSKPKVCNFVAKKCNAL